MSKLCILAVDAVNVKNEIRKQLVKRNKNFDIFTDVIKTFFNTIDEYVKENNDIDGNIEFEMKNSEFKDLRKVITYLDDEYAYSLFRFKSRIKEIEKKNSNKYDNIKQNKEEELTLINESISFNLNKLKINKSIKDDISLLLDKKSRILNIK